MFAGNRQYKKKKSLTSLDIWYIHETYEKNQNKIVPLNFKGKKKIERKWKKETALH